MVNYTLPTSDNLNVSAGFMGILNYINNASSFWVSRLMLVSIYALIVMAYYNSKRDFVGGFAIAGFGTFVIALLLFIVGFVQPMDLTFSVAVMIIGVAWILFDKQGTA